MRRYDAIIVDWGNTLVDYPLRTFAEQISFLRSFLRDHADLIDSHSPIGTATAVADAAWLKAFNDERDDLAVRPFRGRLQSLLGDNAPSALLDELESRLRARIFASGVVLGGAVQMLEDVRRAGYRIGVLSNTPWGTSPAAWANEIRRHALVRDCSVAVVVCGNTGFRKPDPRAFRHCLQVLAVEPAAAVMLGDSLISDVIGARRCGLAAVWFNRDGAPNPENHPAVTRLDDVAALLAL